MKHQSLARRTAKIALLAVLVPAWLWAGAALAFHPGLPVLGRSAAESVFVVASGFALWRVPQKWRIATIASLILAVIGVWFLVRPSAQRTWASGQEQTPLMTLAGDIATVRNVRNAVWRSDVDVEIRWETRQFDLGRIQSVDLVVEPFHDWRGIAHIFVTFGFEGSEHIAISIEARREAGESYSPLAGAFRHYEVLYIVGDERDLIGLRANIRRDPVYVFPTRATPAEARQLFSSMLQRAGRLSSQPEFYNTATTTCATTLLAHVNEVRSNKISVLDWRIMFPGYADELAWDFALIDFPGTIAQARDRFLINERSAFDPALDGPAWSRKIRAAP